MLHRIQILNRHVDQKIFAVMQGEHKANIFYFMCWIIFFFVIYEQSFGKLS
ncbi:hypothetical protein HMPREF9104_03227 [Lentilactobacillus kisonensis F0435]|uniref:Uncharacterized protein n=1 Tax=Lentilactobacillus kisonensis F0435 TaxID=797516 RepID=H1LKS3_9LACO|nr:hypothetical protein HMPREF9104_03227 [Lentilactobacillus kisonensis F0435]